MADPTQPTAGTAPTSPRYGQIDPDYARRLATTSPEDDAPVWMVNLMAYRERADYLDGREVDISGREADNLYAPLGPLAAVGAEVVFAGDVVEQLLGGSPRWDRVGVVKYPTRRSFVEMQSRPDYRALHVHKDAGMAQTIVIGCRPMATPSAEGVELPDWGDVPHPPSDDDPPVMILHVIRFADAESAHVSPIDMEVYTGVAAEVAVPHGVRIGAWFAAEGTIVGDGRSWHQVRFNAFPSRAAFIAVATDPRRLEAQRRHREAAIADTYTLMLHPMIDRLAESLPG